MYICPVCRKKLNRSDNSWRCESGHCFDIARKGYVNLLTTAGRNPAAAGDNADMVKARTGFLDRGYYKPLAEKLREVTAGELQYKSAPVIIDSGCGEGFYTAELAKIQSAAIYGIDISKHAVAHCMTRIHTAGIKNCNFAVASSYQLPFPDESSNAVISVFAPVCGDEYSRVLKRSGALIIVSPSPKHLFELKAAIYDEPYENKPNVYHLSSFEKSGELLLEYTAQIASAEDIRSLFMMSPYRYKTSAEGVARLNALESIDVTCGFVIEVYHKK